jgi:hypothetical protein
MTTSRREVIRLAGSALALGALFFPVTPSAAASALAARSSDANGVRVVVTPKQADPGAGWTFEVVMDTHTQPLDADLTKSSVLIDDAGRRYLPLSWQGDPPGGHHRKGALRFATGNADLKSFELQIEGLAGAGKRVFQWTIK